MMDAMLLDILNTACTILTVSCALFLAIKGDKMLVWPIYAIAACIGVLYFTFMEDWRQVIIWIIFFIGDLLAYMRHANKKVERKPCPHCGKDVNTIDSFLASKISFTVDVDECDRCPDWIKCSTDDSFKCTAGDRTKNIERDI